jgi:WW domain-containing oxidoreductase
MKITAMESGIEGRVVIVASDSYKHTYREGIRFDKLNDASGYCFFTLTCFLVFGG